MVQEGLIDIIIGIYTARPAVTIIQIINLILAVLIATKLINYAVALKGKSLSFALRYLAYAFFLLALIAIVQFLSVLPWFEWDVVQGIAMLVFLLIASYAINHLAETVRAYSDIRKRY